MRHYLLQHYPFSIVYLDDNRRGNGLQSARRFGLEFGKVAASRISAMASKSKPGKIHLRIIEAMKRFPGGISGGQIRQELEKEGLDPGEQTHLDRRKRDLKKWFVIKKTVANIVVNGHNRRVALYKYAGKDRMLWMRGRSA